MIALFIRHCSGWVQHCSADSSLPATVHSSRSASICFEFSPSPADCLIVLYVQGIGLEFVKQLLAKDNTVAAAVRSPSTATQLQELQQQHPPSSTGSRKLHITTVDVSEPSSIQGWASNLRDKCPGLRHLDVVINNAGAPAASGKQCGWHQNLVGQVMQTQLKYSNTVGQSSFDCAQCEGSLH